MNIFKKLFSRKSNVELKVKEEVRDEEKVIKKSKYIKLRDCEVKHLTGNSKPILTNPEDSRDETKPIVLFMDNCTIFSSVITSSILRMKRKYNVDIFKDFQVYLSFGPECGREVGKFIQDYKVDHAFLDITLEETVIENDVPRKLDGVDVAINIRESNPDCKLYFLTSHTLSTKMPLLQKYFIKFKEHIGQGELGDYHLDKNDIISQDLILSALYPDFKKDK